MCVCVREKAKSLCRYGPFPLVQVSVAWIMIIIDSYNVLALPSLTGNRQISLESEF